MLNHSLNSCIFWMLLFDRCLFKSPLEFRAIKSWYIFIINVLYNILNCRQGKMMMRPEHVLHGFFALFCYSIDVHGVTNNNRMGWSLCLFVVVACIFDSNTKKNEEITFSSENKRWFFLVNHRKSCRKQFFQNILLNGVLLFRLFGYQHIFCEPLSSTGFIYYEG